MQRKGSYFFVIDAFVAGIIVVAAFVVLFAGFTDKPAAEQAFYTAEDLLLVLDDTKVKDYDSEMVRNWTEGGLITDTSRTLLQQISFFKATGNETAAKQLANLTILEVPDHVGVALLVESDIYADKFVLKSEDADVFFSSKRIVLVRGEITEVYPPIVIEVQTWQ